MGIGYGSETSMYTVCTSNGLELGGWRMQRKGWNMRVRQNLNANMP